MRGRRHLQGPVMLRPNDGPVWSSRREVADGEGTITPYAIEVASITINAFDHRIDRCARLPNPQLPGALALSPVVHCNLPYTANSRRIRIGSVKLSIQLRSNGNAVATPTESPFENSILKGGIERIGVLIELEYQMSVSVTATRSG